MVKGLSGLKNRLNKTDFVFGIVLVLSLFFLFFFFFGVPYSQDEPFYLTIPFRLMNGDSLVRDEWHLTQFSSLFSFLPTLLWVKLTGSTEGIVLFSRFIYISLQTVITVAVYRFFRRYKLWAVVAAFLYLTQFVNIMWQISYHSMFVCFLLLLTFSIFSIYKSSSVRLYVFAGICFGAGCVCNPVFCVAFGIYLVFCLLWKYRKVLLKPVIRFKIKKNQLEKIVLEKIPFGKKGKASKSKKKNKRGKLKSQKGKNNNSKLQIEVLESEKETNFFPDMENYCCFFSGKAVICFSIGIFIIAAVAIIFFFATGGTVSSVFNNIDNILNFSDYSARGGIISKFAEVNYVFNLLSFEKPFLLPLLLLILLLDKKRTENSHRGVYLFLTFLLAIMYSVSAFREVVSDLYFLEFPFFLFSTVCYIVTKNKNTTLFRCVWLPSVIGMLFHLFASGSLLSAANVILIISNTAGVFFVAGLFKEIYSEQKNVSEQKNSSTKNKLFSGIVCCMLGVAVCLQMFFHMAFYQTAFYTPDSNIKATVGPYAGLSMTQEQYDNYSKIIHDLDYIKEQTDENSRAYINSYQNWMYLYLERPFGIYTSYYPSHPYLEAMQVYFKENPENIPEYIYVPYNDYFNNEYYEITTESIMNTLDKMFEFTTEELSNGKLLTVTKYEG